MTQQAEALIPDYHQAKRFLQALDPTAEWFSFRTFSDTPYTRLPGRDPLERAIHGGLDACWEELTELYRRGAAVCATINQTNGRGRSIADIRRVRALFLDDDHPPRLVDRFPLTPQIQVQSSPGHYHHYWLVRDLPLASFTPLQRALADSYGGDKKVLALNHAMQIPGIWRRKQLSRPVMPTLYKINKLPAYSEIDLERLFAG